MLLSICISYMFQVICLISYLVFKLEVVVMAGCQMFRLSCLQHILMWIYWWMRRKFLIKSTVQNKTHVSFDEVLNNTALRTELKFSSSCSFANVSVQHCFGIAALGSCVREIAGNVMSCSWFILLTLNIAVLLLLTQFWPDSSKQNLSFVRSCTKAPCFWGRLKFDRCALMIQAKPVNRRWLPFSQSPQGTDLQSRSEERDMR